MIKIIIHINKLNSRGNGYKLTSITEQLNYSIKTIHSLYVYPSIPFYNPFHLFDCCTTFTPLFPIGTHSSLQWFLLFFLLKIVFPIQSCGCGNVVVTVFAIFIVYVWLSLAPVSAFLLIHCGRGLVMFSFVIACHVIVTLTTFDVCNARARRLALTRFFWSPPISALCHRMDRCCGLVKYTTSRSSVVPIKSKVALVL